MTPGRASPRRLCCALGVSLHHARPGAGSPVRGDDHGEQIQKWDYDHGEHEACKQEAWYEQHSTLDDPDPDVDASAEAGQRRRMEPIGGMEYQLFLPKSWNAYGSERYPVVVFLHGHGDGKFSVMNSQSLPRLLSPDQSTSFDSRRCWCLEEEYSPLAQEEGTEEGDSLDGPARHLDAPLADCDFADTFPAIVVMPQGWLPDAAHTGWRGEKTQMQVFDITKHVLQRYRGDPNRVVLTGQSQGGVGAWEFAAKHGSLWSAVNPICGPYPPRVADALEGMPVWVVGNAEDGKRGNDAVVEALAKRARGEVRYTRYLKAPPPPDPAYNNMAGHGSYDLIYRDPRLWKWALGHSNAAGPKAWGLEDKLAGIS